MSTKKQVSKYPGKAPVDKEKMKKYYKGEGINIKSIKTKTLRQKFKAKDAIRNKIPEQATETELLLTEECGFIENEPWETTTQFKQKEIVDNVDLASAAKRFKLDLEFGPYYLKYTRNGRNILLGGKRGHVAAFDWVTKNLSCELNVMESIHDVCWLHIETMFAVAQKKWVYIYDNQGIEIKCLKMMNEVTNLEFLPYHFLLTSANVNGWLIWLDVSTGKLVKQLNSFLGRINVMTQNPSNGLLCVGDSKGVVSMWSPNSNKPLAKMLCHQNMITSVATHPHGTLMATSCPDRSVKVWDLRNLSGPLQTCILRSPAHKLTYSQKGLLGISMKNVVEVYRENESHLKAYTRYVTNWAASDLEFCPYEDVLGIGTLKGFESILVPGSGEANFDALVDNPFQTKSQRREREVHSLLEKIQPELISLDPSSIIEVDVPTLEDKIEQKKNLMTVKVKNIDIKSRRTHAKGKGGTAKVIKTKKILKEQARRMAISKMQKDKKKIIKEKIKKQKEKYGVLNRFAPKPT